jgi:hypothetical protein
VNHSRSIKDKIIAGGIVGNIEFRSSSSIATIFPKVQGLILDKVIFLDFGLNA